MFVRDRIRIGYVEAAEFHSVLLNYGDEKRAVEPPAGVLDLLSIHISFLALSELDPSQSRDKFSERNALFVSAYMKMNDDLSVMYVFIFRPRLIRLSVWLTRALRPFIKNVRSIFGIFDLFSPCPH